MRTWQTAALATTLVLTPFLSACLPGKANKGGQDGGAVYSSICEINKSQIQERRVVNLVARYVVVRNQASYLEDDSCESDNLLLADGWVEADETVRSFYAAGDAKCAAAHESLCSINANVDIVATLAADAKGRLVAKIMHVNSFKFLKETGKTKGIKGDN